MVKIIELLQQGQCVQSHSEGHQGIISLPSKVEKLPENAFVEVLVARAVDIERYAAIPDAGWDLLDLTDDPISLRLEVIKALEGLVEVGDYLNFRVCQEQRLFHLITRMRTPLLFIHGNHAHSGSLATNENKRRKIKRIQLSVDGRVAVLPDVD